MADGFLNVDRVLMRTRAWPVILFAGVVVAEVLLLRWGWGRLHDRLGESPRALAELQFGVAHETVTVPGRWQSAVGTDLIIVLVAQVWSIGWLSSGLPKSVDTRVRKLCEAAVAVAVAGALSAITVAAILYDPDNDLFDRSGWAFLVTPLPWIRWLSLGVALPAALFAMWHRLTSGRGRDVDPSEHADHEPVGVHDTDRLDRPAPRTGRVAVCCSGGGIRSAAFSLGALHALEKTGIMSQAARLAAVSGGNYAATAWTIERHLEGEGASSRVLQRLIGEFDPAHEVPHRSKRSGETSSAGLHRFLLRGPGGIEASIALAVLAVAFNVVLVGAVTFVAARPYGWLLQSSALFGDLSAMSDIEITYRHWRPILALAAIGAGSHVLTIGARFFRKVALAAWAGAATIFVLAVAGPWLLRSVAALLAGEDARVIVGSASAVALIGSASRMLLKPLTRVWPRLGGAVLAAALLVTFGYAARSWAVGQGWITDPLVWWGSVLVYAMFAFGIMDTQWISIRELYRSRLTNSFVRPDDGTPSDDSRVRPIGLIKRNKYVSRPFFSGTPEDHVAGVTWEKLAAAGSALPELIVCCSASRVGVASTGAAAESYSISPFNIVHRAEAGPRRQPTSAFVRRLDSNALLPLRGPAGWMATSGAAFASAMGRLSLGSSGALLAALNVDLGIWVPGLHHGQRQSRLPPIALGNLVDEILGFYGDDNLHTFVSDGGHFENLGLAELLIRLEEEETVSAETPFAIFCFDASNDSERRSFATLHAALEAADAALEKRLHFDLGCLPTDRDRELADNCFVIKARLADSDDIVGRIFYAKLESARSLDRDLRRYLNTDPRAARVATRNQFLTDHHFRFLARMGHVAGLELHRRFQAVP